MRAFSCPKVIPATASFTAGANRTPVSCRSHSSGGCPTSPTMLLLHEVSVISAASGEQLLVMIRKPANKPSAGRHGAIFYEMPLSPASRKISGATCLRLTLAHTRERLAPSGNQCKTSTPARSSGRIALMRSCCKLMYCRRR